MEKTRQNDTRERRNAARNMSAAHRMAAETVRAYPGTDYRATLAEAMREIRIEETDARAAWERMDGAAQLDALRRMVGTIKRRDGAIIGPKGNILPPVLEWAINPGDLDAVAHEGWIRAAEIMERSDGDELPPLGMILFRACWHAAQYIARQERRSARAIRYEAQAGPDGEQTERAYIIDHAAPTADRIAPDPEAAAVLRDLLARAARTPEERALLRARARGYTIAEIAAAAGYADHSPIARRIQRIKERFEEETRPQP